MNGEKQKRKTQNGEKEIVRIVPIPTIGAAFQIDRRQDKEDACNKGRRPGAAHRAAGDEESGNHKRQQKKRGKAHAVHEVCIRLKEFDDFVNKGTDVRMPGVGLPVADRRQHEVIEIVTAFDRGTDGAFFEDILGQGKEVVGICF